MDAQHDHGAADTVPLVERAYLFGPFRFMPGQQLLLHEDTPLRIGGRALEILAALVERPGELVTKQELFARVWPVHVVEESNLKVNMAGLRKALGESGRESRYIATLSGQGYRFVAPITRSARPGSAGAGPADAAGDAGRAGLQAAHSLSRK